MPVDGRVLDRMAQMVLASNIGVVRNGHLNFGGTSGPEGGAGTPPGNFQGMLIQKAIAYDSSELATSSGSTSLWDNLNHIRQAIIDSGSSGGGSLSNIGFYSGTSTGSSFIGSGSNIAFDSNFTVSMNGQTALVDTAPNFITSDSLISGSLVGSRWLQVGSGSAGSLYGAMLYGGGYYGGNSGSDVVGMINGSIYLGYSAANDILGTVPTSGSATHGLYWGSTLISSPGSGGSGYWTLSGGSLIPTTTTNLLWPTGGMKSPYTHTVIVDIGGKGDFTSIGLACNHVATQSPGVDSTWLVDVKPGTYVESPFTIPTYTTVRGSQTYPMSEIAMNTYISAAADLTAGAFITGGSRASLSSIGVIATCGAAASAECQIFTGTALRVYNCYFFGTQSSATQLFSCIKPTAGGVWCFNSTVQLSGANTRIVYTTVGNSFIFDTWLRGAPAYYYYDTTGNAELIRVFLGNIGTGPVATTADISIQSGNLYIDSTTYRTSSGAGTVVHLDRWKTTKAGVREAASPTDVPSTVRGAASQSGNLAEWQDSALTILDKFDAAGRLGLQMGATALTAYLHLAAGTVAAGTAPIKLTAGSLLTTPEAGATEWNGVNLFVTQTSGPTRQQLAYATDLKYLPQADHFADGSNVTTTETDLYSDTLSAGLLATNGDKIKADYGGVFVSSATATRQIKVYFGGTVIFDTGALTLSLSAAWVAQVTIIRVSATVIRYSISFTTEGAALAAYTSVGELTGLTLSATNVLKITGQASGVGAASSDIVAKMGSAAWVSHV